MNNLRKKKYLLIKLETIRRYNKQLDKLYKNDLSKIIQ